MRRLAEMTVRSRTGAACCVVMASKGYPESYETGYPITIPPELGACVYVAGARQQEGQAGDRRRPRAGCDGGGKRPARTPCRKPTVNESDRFILRMPSTGRTSGARALAGSKGELIMVYRVFVEKKPELAAEAKALLFDIRTLLGIDSLENVRVINRYDAENIDAGAV